VRLLRHGKHHFYLLATPIVHTVMRQMVSYLILLALGEAPENPRQNRKLSCEKQGQPILQQFYNVFDSLD